MCSSALLLNFPPDQTRRKSLVLSDPQVSHLRVTRNKQGDSWEARSPTPSTQEMTAHSSCCSGHVSQWLLISNPSCTIGMEGALPTVSLFPLGLLLCMASYNVLFVTIQILCLCIAPFPPGSLELLQMEACSTLQIHLALLTL